MTAPKTVKVRSSQREVIVPSSLCAGKIVCVRVKPESDEAPCELGLSKRSGGV
jgi:hypothetical protein